MTGEKEEEAFTGALTQLAAVVAPKVHELGEEYGAAFERALWPEGAPAVVSWTAMWKRHLERAHEAADELVRVDVEIATALGRPWPGGASVSAETAARVARVQRTLEEAAAMDKSVADLVLFDGEPPPERLSVAELIAHSAAAMLWLAQQVRAASEPAGPALMLRMMVAEVLTRLMALCFLAGHRERAGALDELLSELSQLGSAPPIESDEPAEPEPALRGVHPVAESGAETAALLARMAEETRRITPAMVELIERDIFGGAPPARVSFGAIQAVIDERCFGEDVPERARAVQRMVVETDELLMPEDDDPFSALELLEATADSLQGASEKLLELPPEERDEIAPGVELQGRLFLLSLVGIGHAAHRQLLVAEIATTVGADPIPFPDELEGGGSA